MQGAGFLFEKLSDRRRDFRLDTIHDAWKSTDIQGDDGVYVAKVPKPDKGWTAFFAELTYANGLKFTTQVRVIPDAAPFKYKQPTRPKP